jgi:hypothetical protein
MCWRATTDTPGKTMEIGGYTIPYTTQHYIDPASKRMLYRLLDHRGITVAEGIEDAALARQFACVPCLIEGYDELLSEVGQAFWACKWDFGMSCPGMGEVALDEGGVFEARYPGAPEDARAFLELRELLKYAEGEPAYGC